MIQLAGTLLFSRDTFRAMQTGLGQPSYDQLVWRPDAVGSACFLISGYLASVSRPLARSTIQHPFPYQPKPVLSGRKATDPMALPVTSWMRATSMVLRSSSPGRNRSGTALPSSS